MTTPEAALKRLKDEFLARVSHELRIPLNTVSGALDVLLEPGESTRIFDAFHQAVVDGTGPAGGLGLGLTIARHIVEQHGGRIWLENEPGGGVRACFTLALASPTCASLD